MLISFIVKQKYIKQIISQDVASVISSEISSKFNQYISQKYSWEFTGYRIDWSKHSFYRRFNWQQNSDEDTASFLQSTCLCHFKNICVIYGANEPGLKVSFEYAKENLDVLMCHGFGTRFLVAVENNRFNYEPKLSYECFVEVDRNTWLTSSS